MHIIKSRYLTWGVYESHTTNGSVDINFWIYFSHFQPKCQFKPFLLCQRVNNIWNTNTKVSPLVRMRGLLKSYHQRFTRYWFRTYFSHFQPKCQFKPFLLCQWVYNMWNTDRKMDLAVKTRALWESCHQQFTRYWFRTYLSHFQPKCQF